jgi:hypothetical protein
MSYSETGSTRWPSRQKANRTAPSHSTSRRESGRQASVRGQIACWPCSIWPRTTRCWRSNTRRWCSESNASRRTPPACTANSRRLVEEVLGFADEDALVLRIRAENRGAARLSLRPFASRRESRIDRLSRGPDRCGRGYSGRTCGSLSLGNSRQSGRLPSPPVPERTPLRSRCRPLLHANETGYTVHPVADGTIGRHRFVGRSSRWRRRLAAHPAPRGPHARSGCDSSSAPAQGDSADRCAVRATGSSQPDTFGGSRNDAGTHRAQSAAVERGRPVTRPRIAGPSSPRRRSEG